LCHIGQYIGMMWWLLVLVSSCLLVEGRPRTIDQVIESAMVTNYGADLLEQNDTVLVEYDILYTKEQWDEIQQQLAAEPGDRSKRKAISYSSYRWTNKIVPYTIQPRKFNNKEMDAIKRSMDDYHRWTCLTFKPRKNEKNYIYIQDGGGCSSYVGMLGRGSQAVTLGRGCRHRSTIVHEFGHAIGFQHEQCRPDRDTYLEVYTKNVHSGMEFNFNKHSQQTANSYGVPYDYMSVMHYGETAFSKNGKITMKAKDPYYQKRMGTAPTLSFPDLKLANHIYGCGKHCGNKKCSGNGYLDKNCKCMCKNNDKGSPIKECGSGGGGGGGNCEDYDRDCGYWAKEGYCNDRNYVDFMRENCRKSCGFC